MQHNHLSKVQNYRTKNRDKQWPFKRNWQDQYCHERLESWRQYHEGNWVLSHLREAKWSSIRYSSSRRQGQSWVVAWSLAEKKSQTGNRVSQVIQERRDTTADTPKVRAVQIVVQQVGQDQWRPHIRITRRLLPSIFVEEEVLSGVTSVGRWLRDRQQPSDSFEYSRKGRYLRFD